MHHRLLIEKALIKKELEIPHMISIQKQDREKLMVNREMIIEEIKIRNIRKSPIPINVRKNECDRR